MLPVSSIRRAMSTAAVVMWTEPVAPPGHSSIACTLSSVSTGCLRVLVQPITRAGRPAR
jgi:hypothetical protein